MMPRKERSEGHPAYEDPGRDDGTATIANGATSVTVSHDLGEVPVQINVTGRHAEVADAHVTSKSASEFTVETGAATTAARDVDWEARI